MSGNCEKLLWHWINKNVRSINNIYDQKLQQYGLTASQVAVLYHLWNQDGLTQKVIQEKLNLRPASVSGLVDILVSKGLIVRSQDGEDARYKRLFLTEEGRKVKNLSIKIIDEIENIMSQGFSEEEKVILVCWMKKLYNNLEKDY